MNHLKLIRVDESDDKILMCECKQLFLEHHPEMIGMDLSRKFMFKKVVGFYLEN